MEETYLSNKSSDLEEKYLEIVRLVNPSLLGQHFFQHSLLNNKLPLVKTYAIYGLHEDPIF